MSEQALPAGQTEEQRQNFGPGTGEAPPLSPVEGEGQTEDAPVEAGPRPKLYHLAFRETSQPRAGSSSITDLARGELVMAQTDHGPEPARIGGPGVELPRIEAGKTLELVSILRRASPEEATRHQNLLQREAEARNFCQARIQDLGLAMKLLRVERYFNGGKIIFYFSAENRVDFRDLVKALVQEFRTRVEMRQIGVRHETQMLGGLGSCGRELCCGLFMRDFVPVSIKMAKEQDLPLNPAKISGLCNRLLCCLTHEYETYRGLKKGMPKLGRTISFAERLFKVTQCKTLQETITLVAVDDHSDVRVLTRDEWERGVLAPARPKTEAEARTGPPSPRPPSAPAKPSSGAAKGHGGGPNSAPGPRPGPGKPSEARSGPNRGEAPRPGGGKPFKPRRGKGQKSVKAPA